MKLPKETNIYKDKEWIGLTIEVLAEHMEDLEKISVYNGDILNEEVAEMKKTFLNIIKKIKTL